MNIYEHQSADGKLTVDVTVKEDGGVEVFFYDLGEAAKRLTGDSDYERALTIPSEELGKLAMHMLAEKFAGDIQAQSKIEAYCAERGIKTSVWTW